MTIADAIRDAIKALTVETGNQPTALKTLEVNWVIRENRKNGILENIEALPVVKAEFFDRFAR